MGMTAWFRRLAACEHGGGIVEYVGVSGLALLVTGWIIVTISAQRFVIGRAMADIHARQITSFESGLGGTANTDAQLYPRVMPPTLPVISIPRLLGSEQASSWWSKLWDELWKERQWTWYRELMERWRDSGWLGWLTASITSLLLDFLFGVNANGEYSVGWVIISIAGTVAIILAGAGLLQKIPGLLKVLFPFLKGQFVQRLLQMMKMLAGKLRLDALIRWLWGKGADLVKELIVDKKWGTWIKELLELLSRHGSKLTPKWLRDLLANKPLLEGLKHLGNLLWEMLNKGGYGVVEFFTKRLFKDILTGKNPFLEGFRRLLIVDSLKDIGKWISEQWNNIGQWINEQRRRISRTAGN